MRRDTLHMTLAFIGEVSEARIETLRQMAARLREDSFMLQIDRIDCWRHNRIVWAGCRQTPSPLSRLAGQLAGNPAESVATGDPRDSGAEKDFVAHVTLLRNADCDSCAIIPEFVAIDWQVNEFVLVESRLSDKGAHYAIIDRWSLLPSRSTRLN